MTPPNIKYTKEEKERRSERRANVTSVGVSMYINACPDIWQPKKKKSYIATKVRDCSKHNDKVGMPALSDRQYEYENSRIVEKSLSCLVALERSATSLCSRSRWTYSTKYHGTFTKITFVDIYMHYYYKDLLTSSPVDPDMPNDSIDLVVRTIKHNVRMNTKASHALAAFGPKLKGSKGRNK
uniref:Uncharacterized protein n=1 Tax=Glossina pallidipes TaxID=7398 RepID=A0A1B0AD47_GLOPL